VYYIYNCHLTCMQCVNDDTNVAVYASVSDLRSIFCVLFVALLLYRVDKRWGKFLTVGVPTDWTCGRQAAESNTNWEIVPSDNYGRKQEHESTHDKSLLVPGRRCSSRLSSWNNNRLNGHRYSTGTQNFSYTLTCMRPLIARH